MANSLLKRRGGRQLARMLEYKGTKRETITLDQFSLADHLYALFGNRPGCHSIAVYCRGDLRNLQEMDHTELEGLPSVGRGLAVKVLVLMHLIASYR